MNEKCTFFKEGALEIATHCYETLKAVIILVSTLLTCIWKMPGSNIDRVNAGIVTRVSHDRFLPY
jgi:hypothetical protein